LFLKKSNVHPGGVVTMARFMVPPPLLPLSPNRVRRNYLGGSLLDRLEGSRTPRDGHLPEDWLASTVRAVNPGLETIPDEGLSWVCPAGGQKMLLMDLLEKESHFYLGTEHHRRLGSQLGFLAKLLDSSMRLHVQAHPTAAFARRHFNSPWGKLEAYVILAVRDEANAYLRLGFQRPPSPAEWKRIVLEQDIAAMDACFDPIPVRVGDVWWVPGGLPHAIGPGILMLEVMEPSDLVVRCEFEREGVVVPPEARFMQAPVDLALQIFDFTPLSIWDVIRRYRVFPEPIGPWEEQLIGPAQTECFSVSRLTVEKPVTLVPEHHLRLGVVAQGAGTLEMGSCRLDLKPGARFLVAASAPAGILRPEPGPPLQILFCRPGEKSTLPSPAASPS
jgi:mannose-6-phosphate isomerase